MARRATGLVRPYPLQVDVSLEEDEYVSRASFHRKMTKSEFIRDALFRIAHHQWELELPGLRQKQQKRNPGIWHKRAGRKRVHRAAG